MATTTDLTHHIQSIRLVDTHEHMRRESDWVENGPDILQDLFGNYVPADLHAAGASPESMRNLMDASQDVKSRFEGIREAWEAIQFTPDTARRSVSSVNMFTDLTNSPATVFSECKIR